MKNGKMNKLEKEQDVSLLLLQQRQSESFQRDLWFDNRQHSFVLLKTQDARRKTQDARR
jgi:hypothetical protein